MEGTCYVTSWQLLWVSAKLKQIASNIFNPPGSGSVRLVWNYHPGWYWNNWPIAPSGCGNQRLEINGHVCSWGLLLKAALTPNVQCSHCGKGGHIWAWDELRCKPTKFHQTIDLMTHIVAIALSLYKIKTNGMNHFQPVTRFSWKTIEADCQWFIALKASECCTVKWTSTVHQIR